MICSTTITSTSITLNNVLVNTSFHSSHIQEEFNDKKEERELEFTNKLFSVFEEEGMVVEHITNLSELSVTSTPIMHLSHMEVFLNCFYHNKK